MSSAFSHTHTHTQEKERKETNKKILGEGIDARERSPPPPSLTTTATATRKLFLDSPLAILVIYSKALTSSFLADRFLARGIVELQLAHAARSAIAAALDLVRRAANALEQLCEQLTLQLLAARRARRRNDFASLGEENLAQPGVHASVRTSH